MSGSSSHSPFNIIARLLKKQIFFSTSIELQPQCGLLSIPPELRLEIYEWLFKDLMAGHSASNLAFVATCRLIHREAQHLAFRKLKFRIPKTSSKLDYHKSMMTLGPLSMHLRNVKITTKIFDLDPCSGCNPFLLMKLPLDLLTIDFGSVSGQSWRQDIMFWNIFMAAFLHTNNTSHQTLDMSSIHESLVPRIKRRIALNTWTYTPARADLHRTLIRCEAKKVSVMINKDLTSDLLWYAFRKFDLVDGVMISVTGKVATIDGLVERIVGLSFYDTATKAVMGVDRLPVESNKTGVQDA